MNPVDEPAAAPPPLSPQVRAWLALALSEAVDRRRALDPLTLLQGLLNAPARPDVWARLDELGVEPQALRDEVRRRLDEA